MSWLDRLRASFRYIRGRLVESILIIAAIAVGVSLVAAMAAFWGDYNAQTDTLLSHPAYREVIAEVVGRESELTAPVAAFTPEAFGEFAFGTENLDLALQTVPGIQYAYLADRSRLRAGISDRLRNAIASGSIAAPGAGNAPGGGTTGGGTRAADGAPDAGEGGSPAGGGRGATVGGTVDATTPGSAAGFDLEQLLQPDGDLITDLPAEWVGTVRATEQFFRAYQLEAATGSVFTDEDVAEGNRIMVLGSTLAQTLFPGEDPVGKRAVFGIQTYTIIGVLEANGVRDVETGLTADQVAFVPNAEAQVSFGGRQVSLNQPPQTLRFAVEDVRDIAVAADQLTAFFDAEYGEGVIRVTAPVEAAAVERERLGRVLVVVLFLAAAALFIAAINLFNLMLMRVIKRTKSVGINRALGASRRDVFASFVNESAVMTVFGMIVGLAASPYVYRLLASSLVSGPVAGLDASWPLLLAGALLATAVSMVFGIWPARQASQIDASLAIRTE